MPEDDTLDCVVMMDGGLWTSVACGTSHRALCMKAKCMDFLHVSLHIRDLTVLGTALGYVQCLLRISRGFPNILLV